MEDIQRDVGLIEAATRNPDGFAAFLAEEALWR